MSDAVLDPLDSSTPPPLPPSPPYRDRSAAVVVVSILVGLIGLGCLGMVALMAIGIGAASAMAPGQQASMRSAIPATAIYLSFAAFFLATGIGSAMVKRWARALLAVVSWLWFAAGVMALVFVVALLPRLKELIASSSPQGAQAPPIGLIVGCMVGAILAIYLALPLLLGLFYSGKNVRATFEAKDRPRWTDRLPTPLLALFLALAFAAASALALPLYGAIPAFG